MIRDQLILDINDELLVSIFAGMGGWCHAMERATGRHVDIACNHNKDAVAGHRINHPQTKHYICDVYELDPVVACNGRLVGWFHMSPDCTHFSQASSGQPRSGKIRSLLWVGLMWAGKLLKAHGRGPRKFSLENVKQIRKLGPLIAKRDPETGRAIKLDAEGKVCGVAALGERVPRERQFLVPDPMHEGRGWRFFLRELRRLGYQYIEDRNIVAADYGARTSRDRLFLLANNDRPVVWPVQTRYKKPVGHQKPRLPVWEVLDFSLPCPSIFTRPKPLVEATLQRIAKGVVDLVLNHPDPFIIPVTHSGSHRVHSVHEPLRTNGGKNKTAGHDARKPLSTTSQRGTQQQFVTAHLAHFQNNCAGRDVRDPLMTVKAGGQHHGVVQCTLGELSPDEEAGAPRVAAFLMRYYSNGGQLGDLRNPLAAVTTKDRLALVTVPIQGTKRVIVDLGLRMLIPRELFSAMGFAPGFIIDRGIYELADGTLETRAFSKTTQVRLCGNAVSPPPAEAIIAANAPELSRYFIGERERLEAVA